MNRPDYLPSIDGLRALAVIAVIVNHVSEKLLPSGYLGVDIFFVISGFVITSSLASEPQKGFGRFISDFYRRRLKRLTPALVLFVVGTGVIISLFNPSPATDINTGIASIFGMSNILLYLQAIDYWGHSAALNPFTHTWSLGVEEQFYLLFPPLVWLALSSRWVRAGHRFLMCTVAILSLASLAGFIYLSETRPAAVFYLMHFRFWELGLGCLLCLFMRGDSGSGYNSYRQASPLLVLLAIVAVLFLPAVYWVQATVTVVALTVLLISCLHCGTRGYALLTHPVSIYIGRISYSLYLWHWGVLVIGRWANDIRWWSVPVQLGTIIVLSICSYHLVERPLRYRHWFSQSDKRVGVAVALVLLVSLPVLFYLAWRPGSVYLGDAHARLEALQTEVAKNIRCGPTPGQEDKRTHTIRVVGDSHSRHIMPMLELIADKCQLDIVGTRNRPGLVLPRGDGSNARSIDRVLKSLSREDILILSSRNRYLYSSPYLNNTGDRWVDHSQKKAQYGYGLDKWLVQLDDIIDKANKKGVSVVLFLPNLEFDVPIPLDRACHNEWFRNPPRECYPTVSAEYLDRRFPTRVYQQVAAREKRHGNFHAFDPIPIFCAQKTHCGRQRDGFNAFKDTNHLTQEGALLMLQGFNEFLISNHILR